MDIDYLLIVIGCWMVAVGQLRFDAHEDVGVTESVAPTGLVEGGRRFINRGCTPAYILSPLQGSYHRSQVTGHRSQVTGHRSQVTGHKPTICPFTIHTSPFTPLHSQFTLHTSRFPYHYSSFIFTSELPPTGPLLPPPKTLPCTVAPS